MLRRLLGVGGGGRRAGRRQGESYAHHVGGGGGRDGEGADQAGNDQQAGGVEVTAAVVSQQHREGDPAPVSCRGSTVSKIDGSVSAVVATAILVALSAVCYTRLKWTTARQQSVRSRRRCGKGALQVTANLIAPSGLHTCSVLKQSEGTYCCVGEKDANKCKDIRKFGGSVYCCSWEQTGHALGGRCTHRMYVWDGTRNRPL